MGWNDDETGSSSRRMAGLFARIVRLPVAAFIYSMEMFVLTLQGLQRYTNDGVDAITGGAQPASDGDATPRRDAHASSNRQKELSAMPDTNLNDDMLKLVRYKVLFVKREYEVAFPEQEELVHDNMNDTAFVAWKIAEFVQQLGDTTMPSKWQMKNYPANQAEKPPDPIARKWKEEKDRGGERRVHWLPEADKKYLRVYYEVLSRYAREKFKHDEREVEVLEQIRDVIQGIGDKGAASGGAGGRGAGKVD